MKLDDADLFVIDLAERRRQRDAEREPRLRRPVPDHRTRQRHAFQARQIDLVNQALDNSITALECPTCLGPVFATADGDRVDCTSCDARLVAHRTLGGELTAIALPDGAP